MTFKTIIDNIRKIAKTDELLKLLKLLENNKEKAPVEGSRGVGYTRTPYQPCQMLYTSEDGIYSINAILSGNATKVTDGTYNQCSQINTIIDAQEILASTYPIPQQQLMMILKPDGVFLPPSSSDFLYTSYLTIDLYFYDEVAELFPAPNYFLFDSVQKVRDVTIAALKILYGEGSAYDIETYALPNLTTEQIDGTNYNTNWPIQGWTLFNNLGNAEDTYNIDNQIIAAYPKNYNYKKDNESNPYYFSISIPQGYLRQEEQVQGFNFMGAYSLDFNALPAKYFQLALGQLDGLWRADVADIVAPIKYKNGVSIVNFRFGDDFTRTGQIHPAKDGGFMIYETSGSEAIGNVFVYRRERTLSTIIPAAQIQAYKP